MTDFLPGLAALAFVLIVFALRCAVLAGMVLLGFWLLQIVGVL